MTEDYQINSREEAQELCNRAANAKFESQAALMLLNRQLGMARAKLANAIAEWQRGVQVSPEQLARLHIQGEQQRRMERVAKGQTATRFVQKRMVGFGSRASTNVAYSGGMPLSALMAKQQRDANNGIGPGILPLKELATPPAPPGSNGNTG